MSAPEPPVGTGQRIWIASGEGDAAKLSELLEQWSGREDVLNWADEFGYTPIITAAFYGHTDCVRLLATTPGVDLQRGDGGDMTALQAAAYFGRTSVVRELLLHIRSPQGLNRPDAFGFTVLHYACREGHGEIVELLLSRPGLDPNLRCTEVGMTPLACAAYNARTKVVALLLAHTGSSRGAGPDTDTDTGVSFGAGVGMDVGGRVGVDVNVRATGGAWAGRTALHFAQAGYCDEAAELIRAAGGVE